MDTVKFTINGVEYTAGGELDSQTMLVDYIRRHLELRGTKYLCREAGCGACTVAVVKYPGGPTVSVNSCLVAVMSMNNWSITTIEKVGNRKEGYHAVQKTLAEGNGTQCGYCTPGWVMAMYSFIKGKKNATMKEIEQAFGSNVCRCTGYRPILESFKKFGSDASQSIKLMDIEDLYICKSTGKACDTNNCTEQDDWCMVSKNGFNNYIDIKLADGKRWYSVSKLKDLYHILRMVRNYDYMLLAGNTAKAIYPIDDFPDNLIDISTVSELKGYEMDQNLIIGSGCTLSEVMDILTNMSSKEYFSYLTNIYDHCDAVAHNQVRNIGTLGGNLMIKHTTNAFPSDVFLLLTTVGAQIYIGDCFGETILVTMENFLKVDMKGKVLLSVVLPPLSNEYVLESYKIMPRAQSSHAIINAGFMYKLNKSTNSVLEARIVYGHVSPTFIRATSTEKYLVGKVLFNNDTLQNALNVLSAEIVVEESPPEPSASFKKQLCLNLFHKGLISLCPEGLLDSRYKSARTKIHAERPLSSASQTYASDTSLWPVNQPMPKVEALIQCSGEAKYTEDLPSVPGEVFGAFVLSTVATGNIVSIDPSDALLLDGVVAFFTANDIPGLNSFTPSDFSFYIANEVVLCDGTVKFYGQPIGIIAATSEKLANKAAKLVKVKYTNVRTPVVKLSEARKDSSKVSLYTTIAAKESGTDVAKVIKGQYSINAQLHMPIETQVCVAIPNEDGLEVHSTTQWIDFTHVMIARALNIDQSRVDVRCRRVGGAYGAKISRNSQISVACCLVAYKLNRPCRFILPLTTVTQVCGKRLPCELEFEIGVNDCGVIQYVKYNLYEDQGYMINEQFYALAVDAINNCYGLSRWTCNFYNVITDTAKNTWCRSPGTLESIAFAEMMLEQISYTLSLDPLEVRLANLDSAYETSIKEMLEELKTTADYANRKAAVNKFNATSRWQKRGLRFAMVRWTPVPMGVNDVILSVFHGDGSVVISHAGAEMGQGINTKAIQVAAYTLKIPMDKIKIKENNTLTSPNSGATGGSLGSQNVMIAVRRACQNLLTNLEPVRSTMDNPTWEELVAQAYNSYVDLQAHGYVCPTDNQEYVVYGIVLTEVLIDCLTGESEICRVDLYEDTGVSTSPEIDVGQVEGAFVMGIGYWKIEHIEYDTTGELLTNKLWNYHVPQCKDIPAVFNVTFKNKTYSTELIFGSKCVGEPPMCMTVGVVLAMRDAMVAARSDAGLPSNVWFDIEGPYNVEHTCANLGTSTTDFVLYS